MNCRLIVKCKSMDDMSRLKRLVHKRKGQGSYWIERPYSRSEWIGVRSPIYIAYVVGCRSTAERFKLELMFSTEQYKGV